MSAPGTESRIAIINIPAFLFLHSSKLKTMEENSNIEPSGGETSCDFN